MTEKCPMCAQEVEIISDPEGTTSYKGLERAAAVEEERERLRERLFAEAAKHKDRTRLRVFIAAALDSDNEEESDG